MNILGYLVTLANFQNFPSKDGPPITDLSVQVDEVQTLAGVLSNDTAFPPTAFRASRFYKVGNIGKYISKNLKDYLYSSGNNVDPKEKGLILTVTFKDAKHSNGTRGTNGAITLNNEDPIPFVGRNMNYSGFFERRKRRSVRRVV